jgi:hypothetical protein
VRYAVPNRVRFPVPLQFTGPVASTHPVLPNEPKTTFLFNKSAPGGVPNPMCLPAPLHPRVLSSTHPVLLNEPKTTFLFNKSNQL